MSEPIEAGHDNLRAAVQPRAGCGQPWPRPRRGWLTFLLALSAAVPVAAILPPERPPALAGREFSHPDLMVGPDLQPGASPGRGGGAPGSALAAGDAVAAGADLAAIGALPDQSFLDARGGTWATLILSQPLLPGNGAGNRLKWTDLGAAAPSGPAAEEALEGAAWTALQRWLGDRAAALRIDPAELSPAPHIALHDGGRVIQLHVPRLVGGVPVRGSFLTAVINGGNLVLLGTSKWAAVKLSVTPTVPVATAMLTVEAHLAPDPLGGWWQRPALEIVPTAAAAGSDKRAIGNGYGHRLVWVLRPLSRGDAATWEALVDAHSGELIAFADQNQYLLRRVHGAIYPVSNDGLSPGGVPDGLEQARHPMPYASIVRQDGTTATTNGAGLVTADGSFDTALAGPYVRINDACGFVSESPSCRDLDLGGSAGTDCAVPAGHSAGDTHSARTGFYEVNRLIEQAKAWIPASHVATHNWLNSQLTANMNIDNSCNAFWTPAGGTINFYREGPPASPACRNTGEIAAVFDHEWGHGLDTFNNVPGVTRPGEAYADIAAILRLNSSCIGRGFFLGGNCPGNGDPCLTCTGVREDDWKQRASGQPHGITWAQAHCGALVPVPIQSGPCNQGTHCEGQIVGEAFWDLIKRDLRCQGVGWEDVAGSVGGGRCTGGAPSTLSENSALEIVTRLYYVGAGNVANWYTCDATVGGCNADSGYLQLLVADDDDGMLANGTPHGQAIFAAFNRHQIACSVINPGNGGCGGALPAGVPTVTATPTRNGASVSWTAVPGAVKYWLFRTEGVHGCDYGKLRIAETAALSYADSGLLDGFTYYYSVIPVGGLLPVVGNDACMGQMSACAAVVPLPPLEAGQPGLSIAAIDHGLQVRGAGDDDPYIDNCEKALLRFEVVNTGGVPLTGVRITGIRPISHPGITILTTLPQWVTSSLPASCGADGRKATNFEFHAAGLSPGATISFDVDVTSHQLFPQVVTGRLVVTDAERDLVMMPQLVFDFESGSQGWVVFQGSFGRTTGVGAEGSLSYLASSAGVNDACDEARSPGVKLTPGSTLSLFNQYVIEPMSADSWYDRANVGIVDANGLRTAVTPDGGRTYEAGPGGPGTFAGCTNPETGWAGAGPGWSQSSWSAAALGSASHLGDPVQLSVKYGSDGTASLAGISIDQVRLTDVLAQGNDQQSNSCSLARCRYRVTGLVEDFDCGTCSQWIGHTRCIQSCTIQNCQATRNKLLPCPTDPLLYCTMALTLDGGCQASCAGTQP